MPPASSASSSRALNAILPLIASGHAYEAHQKARTFASRYIKSGQHDIAADVLFQSARELLKAGQAGSGVDLGCFLVDVFDGAGGSVTEDRRGKLTQLIALTGPSGNWRKTLIDKAIAWSIKVGPYPAGDVDLHHYCGQLEFKDGSFEQAEHHLLSSGQRDSARVLAEMFFEWWKSSSSSDKSTLAAFALRGTIPYLLNGNILAARVFITTFVSLTVSSKPSLRSTLQQTPLPVPIVQQPPPPTSTSKTDEIIFTTDPILNFCQLAVRTCQRAQGDKNKAIREAWVRLCGTYLSRGGVIARPEVRKYLNELATLYFAIPPPRGQAANPFGDMISSLLGGPTSGPASGPRVITPGPTAPGLD